MKNRFKKSEDFQPSQSVTEISSFGNNFVAGLLGESPAPIIVSTPDEVIIYVNQAIENITGYSSAELVGTRPPFPWWPRDVSSQYHAEDQRSLMKDLTTHERIAIRKSGEKFWMSIIVHHIKENGKLKYLIGTCLDITDRKKAEEALKESEAFKDTLLTQSPNPVVVCSGDNIVKYVNIAFENITGYSHTEVVGLHSPFPWWPEQNAAIYESKTFNDKNTPVANEERCYQKKNGQPFWVSVTIRRIKEKGQTKYFMGSWVDITERKKMEDALRESEAFKDTLLTQSPNPVVVYNEDDSIYYVNPAFERFTGFSSTDVIGCNSPYPWWPLQFSAAYSSFKTKSVRGPVENLERCLQKKNGELFWVSISFRAVMEKDNVKFNITSWFDITERKKTEEALKESQAFAASLQDNAPNPILVVNPDSTIRYVNTALVNITGFSRNEILGMKTPYPWWPPEIFNDYEKYPGRKSGEVRSREALFRRKDGSRFWVTYSIRKVKEAGKLKYSLGNWVDITERKKTEAALRDSEAFTLSLLEYAPNPIMVVNPDSSIRYVNRSLETITGYSRSEILGIKTPYPWWPPQTVSEYNKTPSRRTEEFDNQEVRLIRKNGSVFWVTANIRAVRENGKAKYVIGNWVDITERKKAQEALEESEAFKAILLNDSPNPILVYQPDGAIIFANSSLEKATGYSNTELIGQKMPYPWWPAEKFEQYEKENLSVTSTGLNFFERNYLRKNGENFWIDVSIRTFKEQGKIKYYIGNWVDITQRKKMEDNLRESESFNVSLLTQAPNPVIVFNPGGTIKYINPAFEKLTSFTAAEVIGRNTPYPWWPQDNQAEYKTGLAEDIAVGINTKQHLFNKRNGKLFWVDVKVRRVEENGSLKYVLSNWVDITQQKMLEERISELYSREKKQREELQEEAQARGLFINVLAHELRAPLTPIMASTGILKDLLEPKNDDLLKKLAGNIYTSTEKLSRRLEDLLDLARYDRGTFRLNLQVASMHDFLRDMVARFEPGLIEHNQHLTTILSTELPTCKFDLSRLEQVLINLLSNASKFSPDGSDIVLKAGLKNDQVLIEIKDLGIGISEENQKKLFRAYHRVEQDRKQFPGLGLGLAVSRQIVEAHGGTIWVKSVPGQGSTFGFNIPLIPVE